MPIPSATYSQMCELRKILNNQYQISELQIVESVAFSMAMVVRSALGLHADNGIVGVIYDDSTAGLISLACARHLVNAGCSIKLIVLGNENFSSPLLQQLLHPLEELHTPPFTWSEIQKLGQTDEFLASCHNVICGLAPTKNNLADIHHKLITELNDHSVPVHCIKAPLGLDITGTTLSQDSLYASSTLSLGIPYLALEKASDFIGRHYLADISLPSIEIEKITGISMPLVFAEQPVIQIYTEEIVAE
jgi:NAD(P)H-hydrate repair Nnr-like enzyme with NAD(P)H-hydrate epimerase domain